MAYDDGVLNHPLLFLEHLSEQDVDVLAAVAGTGSARTDFRNELSRQPEAIDGFLAEPALFDAVFENPVGGINAQVTPFLPFGILVNRLTSDLNDTSYVEEWAGPGKRLPVFDVASLQDFARDGGRRYFLIEFLASFTRVASGAMWVRTRKGYQKRRFSELDPVRLAEMVEALPVSQRPAGYRRLGDVSLFLSGLFPDHTARNPLTAHEQRHLAMSAGIEVDIDPESEDLAFYENTGSAWYRRAVNVSASLVGVGPEFLLDVADRYNQARRFLNYLADRYLYRLDSGLLGPAS